MIRYEKIRIPKNKTQFCETYTLPVYSESNFIRYNRNRLFIVILLLLLLWITPYRRNVINNNITLTGRKSHRDT